MNRDAFIKILDQLAEPETAAAAAKRVVWTMKQADVTWDNLLAPYAMMQAPPPPAPGTTDEIPAAPQMGTGRYATACALLIEKGRLTAEELGFVVSVSHRATLTEAMVPIWDRIVDKNRDLKNQDLYVAIS